jgi:hypothetical protein
MPDGGKREGGKPEGGKQVIVPPMVPGEPISAPDLRPATPSLPASPRTLDLGRSPY